METEDRTAKVNEGKPERRPLRYERGIAISAGALSLLSLGLFGLFLLIGGYDLIRLQWREPYRLGLNAFLSMAFFAQHSLMASRAFRRWQRDRCPRWGFQVVYAFVSSFALLLVLALWQGPLPLVWSVPVPWRWAVRGLFVLGLAWFAWGALAMTGRDPLGWRKLAGLPAADPAGPDPLLRSGPYAWVRHPQYLAALLMIWSHPDLTSDRILFTILWSGWVAAAAKREEGDLIARYGQAYRDYQRAVPMLLPRPWRRTNHQEGESKTPGED